MEGDGFSLFLDLVGSGRGPGARVRRWSAIVFILMVIVGGIAIYMWFSVLPKKIDAADFETGQQLPPSTTESIAISRGLGPNVGVTTKTHHIPYELRGHLLDAHTVIADWRGQRWISTPLVSETPGSTNHPRFYFCAIEASYLRSRTENRFVGFLMGDPFGFFRNQFEMAGRPLPSDAVFLFDDGTLRGAAASGLSLIVFALIGGVVSLFLFLMAARRARPDDDVAASSLMPSPLPDRTDPSP